MKPEEKFDRIIKEIINAEIVEHPSPAFTDNVLEKMGFRKTASKSIAKPILSKWAKIAITCCYITVIALLIIFSKGEAATSSKYLNLLPKFQLPSLTSLIDSNGQMYSILVVLIGAGWLLIFIDSYIKKTMTR